MCVIGGDFSEVRGEALFCLALTSPTRQPSLCYSFCSSEKWTLCSAQSTRASERIYRLEIKYFSSMLVNLMMNTLSSHPHIYLYCRNGDSFLLFSTDSDLQVKRHLGSSFVLQTVMYFSNHLPGFESPLQSLAVEKGQITACVHAACMYSVCRLRTGFTFTLCSEKILTAAVASPTC